MKAIARRGLPVQIAALAGVAPHPETVKYLNRDSG
jgi:hypothetical protein